MSTFLGIGLGPIQTGIFILGATQGGFKRIVIAEVDPKLKAAIDADGGMISINIAMRDSVRVERLGPVEIHSPIDSTGLAALTAAATEADEINTALPGVDFFSRVAPWLTEGFRRAPSRKRLVYTSENNNHAAELLDKAMGPGFPNTHYLNTVIGKMSCVVPAADCQSRGLATLSPSADRGHLVEEFNRILVSTVPDVEDRKVQGLRPVKNVLPFEEAKLFGHNAVHLLLGLHALEAGMEHMHLLAGEPALIEKGREAFHEVGAALAVKWRGADPLFTESGFNAYAEDLLVRMVNPFLMDPVDRVCRDLPRKLAWGDRLVGAMRLCLENGQHPAEFAEAARIAALKAYGTDSLAVRAALLKSWGSADLAMADAVLKLIAPFTL